MSDLDAAVDACPECKQVNPCRTPWQCAENVVARREGRPPREVVIVDVYVEHIAMVKTKPCVCGRTAGTIEPAMVAAARRVGSYLPEAIPCPCGRLVVGCNFRVKAAELVTGRPS